MANDTGIYTTGFGTGLLDFYTMNGGSGNVSIQNTVIRNGPKALKIAHSSSLDNINQSRDITSPLWSAVYHRVATVPGVDVTCLNLGYYAVFPRWGGIGIHNGNYCTWALGNIGPTGQTQGTDVQWGAAGPAVVANTWARIETRNSSEGSSNKVITVDGYVDGVALPGVTYTCYAHSGSMSHAHLGNWMNGTNTFTSAPPTFTEYFADWIVEGTDSASPNAHWPFGAYTVETLKPNRDGTHLNAADFSNQVPTSSPTAYTVLDTTSLSDTTYVQQDAYDATSYLEVGFEPLVNRLTPMCVTVHYVRGQSILNDYYYNTMKFQDPRYGLDIVYSGLQHSTLLDPSPGDPGEGYGTLWNVGNNKTPLFSSPTDVDNLLIRWGYSQLYTAATDPRPRLYGLVLEVAVQETPTDGKDGWGWFDGQEAWHFML